MQDKAISASVILGICLIISSFLLSSGMKALGRGIQDAGVSVGNGLSHGSRSSKQLEVDLSLSGGGNPIRIREYKEN